MGVDSAFDGPALSQIASADLSYAFPALYTVRNGVVAEMVVSTN